MKKIPEPSKTITRQDCEEVLRQVSPRKLQQTLTLLKLIEDASPSIIDRGIRNIENALLIAQISQGDQSVRGL